jgi:hypothetical protein
MKQLQVFFVVAVSFIFAATAAYGGQGTAVPAGTATFSGCTATFVRSASGIVNETNRVCPDGAQNPWASANVYLQFRPINGTPNSNCDPNGLVTSFGPWSTSESTILKWFLSSAYQYNVCVYLVNPVVAAGTIDSSFPDGSTTATLPVSGSYKACVSGTYANADINAADAEYITIDNWITYGDGDTIPGWTVLGKGFGDVQIDSQFVDWGVYSPTHDYCVTVSKTVGSTLNLAVFDGYSDTPTKMPEWYADNVGTLSYTVKYMGQ